ncbi:MAG: AmmeMemoRadiSam system radical SAM enzyme [Pirellulales bacterium]|nr:AmmeMemoRadiSam system radical SAM enzyme [Pirellulales bacterium]
MVQEPQRELPTRYSRRAALKFGLGGLACTLCGGAGVYYIAEKFRSVGSADVFKKDAPAGPFWEEWQAQGWACEARHYLKLGRNIQCKLCPNECLLEPEDRGHCRNRVHKDGKLYTLAYANPCAFHVDPIEKKPLLHFLPETPVFSIATSGCCLRCLNCQNWDISQRKPEETKDPRGLPVRLTPSQLNSLGDVDPSHVTMLPEDVVDLATCLDCPSIAYTYSEPIVWFEYMMDTARLARAKDIKNCWITCGSIQNEPLLELCKVIDAANVNLKSFDEDIYRDLNTGKLEPVLATLETLKREGVWFEVTNLVVPTYTDKPEMIRRMCDWLFDNLGPDYPLHFSRFHPAHKLTHLPPTPVDTLDEARDIARSAGLHFVYVGNCQEIPDGETTICPGCRKPIIRRNYFSVLSNDIVAGKCKWCGTKIAGIWG